MSPDAEFVLQCLLPRQRNRRLVELDVLVAAQRRRLTKGMKDLARDGYGRYRKGRGLEFIGQTLLESLDRLTRPGSAPSLAESNGNGATGAAEGRGGSEEVSHA